MDTAKVFWSGRSQAVRLPKDYRFECRQVRIRRRGRAVILEPIAQDWKWLEGIIGPVDEVFEREATRQPAEQERPGLADLFR